MQTADPNTNYNMYTTNNIKKQYNELCAIKLKENLNSRFQKQASIIDKFRIIEDGLDLDDNEESNDNKRRRGKWGSKGLEFKHVSSKAVQEDMDKIFGIKRQQQPKLPTLEFKKNDQVICQLNKKLFKGVIFEVNFKGIVIKTLNRKKIKLDWENIDGTEIKVTKVKNTY